MASLHRGGKWVVEVDIEHFFDTASHERLMAAVAEVVADGRILRLVQAFLQAGVMEEGKRRTLVAGTPQGACLSPLLSNAFLNTFDHQMLARGRRAVHYCNDLVIVCRTREEAEAALEQVHQILEGQLGFAAAPREDAGCPYHGGIRVLGIPLLARGPRTSPAAKNPSRTGATRQGPLVNTAQATASTILWPC